MEYGSGAVMSVPAHDQRDWEFAKKYGLPIKQVIEATNANQDLEKGALTDKHTLINSGPFDGLDFASGFDAITQALNEKGLGDRQVNYRLRD